MARKIRLYRAFGQSTTEYAVLLALVATAIIAMQVYVRRGLQGRIKGLADQISGDKGITQYEEGRTMSSYNITQEGNIFQTYRGGAASITQGETVTRRGNETVLPDLPPDKIKQ